MKRTTMSERALIFAPRGRDATIAAAILRDATIETQICVSTAELIASLNSGAGIVVVTEEALTAVDQRPIVSWLADQQEWSDFPFILLTRHGGGLERNPAARRHLEALGNVTFLERPFHPTTLVSLARAAIRGRRRQYDARARLIELRESEDRYSKLFGAMDEGFCVIRFVDGPLGPLSDFVHASANSAYTRHTGIDNVVGQYVREMLPDEAEGWVDIYRHVLLSGEPVRLERQLVATGRHLELSAFRVEPRERNEVAVLFQDVTDRKAAEAKLRDLNETLERRVGTAIAEQQAATAQLHEAQKLETIGHLTGGVAHDFNNLLTPIMSTLDILNRRMPKDDPRMTNLLQGALQSAERARTLVSRLLGFARRQVLETRPTNVHDLLGGMQDLIKSSIGPAIALKLECPNDLPGTVADPNQLELAILNLCVNARDAMPDGGRLTITALPCHVDDAEIAGLSAGHYVCITVADTGVGMDDKTLARAVEPFYSTKEIGKGTGLGLSMVHGLAGQLSGAFALSSKLGQGTQACFYLPVAKGTVPNKAIVSCDNGQRVRPLHIMLVDDEDLVRAGTAEMLREMGHVVHDVASGKLALRDLEAGFKADLVVTDYMMPDLNGAELAEVLRAQEPKRPILLITGYAGGDLDIAVPQLAKPFRQSDLANGVQRAINSAAMNSVS